LSRERSELRVERARVRSDEHDDEFGGLARCDANASTYRLRHLDRRRGQTRAEVDEERLAGGARLGRGVRGEVEPERRHRALALLVETLADVSMPHERQARDEPLLEEDHAAALPDARPVAVLLEHARAVDEDRRPWLLANGIDERGEDELALGLLRHLEHLE